MRNKKEIKKSDFKSVKFFRSVKEKIAEKLEGMTFTEKKEYIRKVLSGEMKVA